MTAGLARARRDAAFAAFRALTAGDVAEPDPHHRQREREQDDSDDDGQDLALGRVRADLLLGHAARGFAADARGGQSDGLAARSRTLDHAGKIKRRALPTGYHRNGSSLLCLAQSTTLSEMHYGVNTSRGPATW